MKKTSTQSLKRIYFAKLRHGKQIINTARNNIDMSLNLTHRQMALHPTPLHDTRSPLGEVVISLALHVRTDTRAHLGGRTQNALHIPLLAMVGIDHILACIATPSFLSSPIAVATLIYTQPQEPLVPLRPSSSGFSPNTSSFVGAVAITYGHNTKPLIRCSCLSFQ